jgi:hypothetical protein
VIRIGRPVPASLGLPVVNIVAMSSGPLLKVLSLLVAATAISTVARICFESPPVDDFRSFYKGASAVALHELANLYRQQRSDKGSLDLPFIRPPVYALMIEPFAHLSFTAAFCLWISIQSAIFLWCIVHAQSIARRAVIACLYPPAILGIGHGQDSLIFLGILIAGYTLFRRQKELAAGIVLGIGLLKFHLFILWPLAFLTQRRWRALTGYCLTGLAIALVSIALVGKAGISDYFAFLTDPRLMGSRPSVAREVGIGALMANMQISSMPVQISLGIILAAIVLFSVRRSSIQWLFVILPAASLVVTPHTLYYDPTLLLLPMWIVSRLPNERLLRALALVLASPLVFIATLLPEPWTIGSSVGSLVFLFTAMRRASFAKEARAAPAKPTE